MLTNQEGLITDQYYDTNSWSFTTNYFHCDDIQLTSGLNIIKLHAVDLAGNIIETNISLNVDYSSKTNAPVILLSWPQNGASVSGSSFTCRGVISDPTASIAVDILVTNADTNIFPDGVYTNMVPRRL